MPESVATLDLIPRLVKEPEYLAEEQIRVFTGSYNGPEVDPTNIDWRQADGKKLRFRQDPGPWNALGLVRLDMPNSHGVYMHDTPMKPLFNQRGRAFSAGCVRVQDVFALVEWVAATSRAGTSPGASQDILAAGQPIDLNLTGRCRCTSPTSPPGPSLTGGIDVPARHLRPRRHARPQRRGRARPRRPSADAVYAGPLTGVRPSGRV